jgi:hypothetical protein
MEMVLQRIPDRQCADRGGAGTFRARVGRFRSGAVVPGMVEIASRSNLPHEHKDPEHARMQLAALGMGCGVDPVLFDWTAWRSPEVSRKPQEGAWNWF